MDTVDRIRHRLCRYQCVTIDSNNITTIANDSSQHIPREYIATKRRKDILYIRICQNRTTGPHWTVDQIMKLIFLFERVYSNDYTEENGVN